MFATSPCSASRNATWIMVARRYHPQVTVTTAHEIEITRYVRRRRGPVLRKEITSNPQAHDKRDAATPKDTHANRDAKCDRRMHVPAPETRPSGPDATRGRRAPRAQRGSGGNRKVDDLA